MRRRSTYNFIFVSLFSAFLIGPVIVNDAFSQSPFYEGKNIRAISGQSPGGLGDSRLKAVLPFLQKYIPGNPHIIVEYMEGAGGQKAANYLYKTARPDGLTIGFYSAGTVPAAVLGQPGVLYDLKEVIFLGAHQTGRPTVFLRAKN